MGYQEHQVSLQGARKSDVSYLALAAAVFALDAAMKGQIEKRCRIGEEKELLGGRVLLRKYHNHGAALDAGRRHPHAVCLLSGLSLLFLCALLLPLLRERGNRALKLGLSLMLGGGASNFYDRVRRGYVVDYVSFRSRFPKLERIVYNFSDFCIFVGAVLVFAGGWDALL